MVDRARVIIRQRDRGSAVARRLAKGAASGCDAALPLLLQRQCFCLCLERCQLLLSRLHEPMLCVASLGMQMDTLQGEPAEHAVLSFEQHVGLATCAHLCYAVLLLRLAGL